ncbi:MAG: hypothetical protein M3Y80_00990 [Verrucomicrobiota bacterium]|nr:hypothetical protein [Verrucomicrobiota bacterium]
MSLGQATSFLWNHPALWPVALFAVVAPVLYGGAGFTRARLSHPEAVALVTGAVLCLGLFAFNVLFYLSSSSFLDLWESLSGSIASLLRNGGEVYPNLAHEERYASPYGPVLYLTIAASQWAFGASVFATKLPCAVAALAAVGLMWGIVYAQSKSIGLASVFAGVEGALLLAFRTQAFWPKPDALILLLVTVGWVVAWQRSWRWGVVMGVCIGLAVDLKPHAAAYFLPLAVLGYRNGWSARAFVVAGFAALLTTALPFALLPHQFPLLNYLRILVMTVHEGFGLDSALNFFKWAVLLAGLLFIADHWQRRDSPAMPPTSRRIRMFYRGAVALGILLVAVPGASIGSGPRHLMPFIPLILLPVSLRLSRRGVEESVPENALWRALTYCVLASCLLIAGQTTGRTVEACSLYSDVHENGRRELQRVAAQYAPAAVLLGAGDNEHVALAFLRHELVFAGNPIGIDLASTMDYRRAGVPESNLAKLGQELRHRCHGRPIVWVLPRGEPFSFVSVYDSRPVFSEAFRREFSDAFELRERSRYFDIYMAKSPIEEPTPF